MKSYKELLNENARYSNLRQLTEDESAAMKKTLVAMYQDIADLCVSKGMI